jgi:hypothetical protein
MNASLIQEVEFRKSYIAQREKEHEMMKAATTSMENELRLENQKYVKAMTERIEVSYAVEQ